MPFRHAHWWVLSAFPVAALAFWPGYLSVLGKAPPSDLLNIVRLRLERLTDSWAAAWAEHADDASRRGDYSALVTSAVRDLNALGAGQIVFTNGVPLMAVLMKAVFDNAVENEGVRNMKASARAAAEKAA